MVVWRLDEGRPRPIHCKLLPSQVMAHTRRLNNSVSGTSVSSRNCGPMGPGGQLRVDISAGQTWYIYSSIPFYCYHTPRPRISVNSAETLLASRLSCISRGLIENDEILLAEGWSLLEPAGAPSGSKMALDVDVARLGLGQGRKIRRSGPWYFWFLKQEHQLEHRKARQGHQPTSTLVSGKL